MMTKELVLEFLGLRYKPNDISVIIALEKQGYVTGWEIYLKDDPNLNGIILSYELLTDIAYVTLLDKNGSALSEMQVCPLLSVLVKWTLQEEIPNNLLGFMYRCDAERIKKALSYEGYASIHIDILDSRENKKIQFLEELTYSDIMESFTSGYEEYVSVLVEAYDKLHINLSTNESEVISAI